ncbi:hypothetical protein ACGFZS_46880 [Streptomyces sp. NPDC048288]|uniref:hypothetical protein n=1 Tax=Streptomyces sp. NPDC048288 TaxID=3365529 RepID=UPI00371946F4
MRNRIGQTVDAQNATTSTITPTTTDFAGRTSRSLFAEARRYASAARNMVEGRYDGIDSDGRQWTVDELYARSAQCRRAGGDAEQTENEAAQLAEDLGPRAQGTVYDNASGTFRVLEVVTDASEARRVLKRNAAQFAVLVEDLHTAGRHYTGAVWTGSDRVLKAVAA